MEERSVWFPFPLRGRATVRGRFSAAFDASTARVKGWKSEEEGHHHVLYSVLGALTTAKHYSSY